MKLHILNDLHIEFTPFVAPETGADVVILAGDIHVGRKGIDWVREQFPGKTVVYVLGNHEYYGQALPKHTQKLQKLVQGCNIHVLENEKLVIDGVVFLGCTLWTDFELFGNPRVAGHEATQRMTDYRKIRVSPRYRRLRSVDTARIHYHSVGWLGEELKMCRGGRVVVVTHHTPSLRSIPEQSRDNLLSAAYASHLDALVEESGARLWVHGHVHTSSDYWIGETRVLCNSRGYSDEYSDSFRADYVVEI